MGLRSNLPALRKGLQERLEKAFDHEIHGPKDSNGISFCSLKNPHMLSATGWIRMPASAASYRIAGKLNCFVILGEKLGESPLMQRYSLRMHSCLISLASDPALAQATLQFAYDAAITSELMRFTPSILQR